MEKTFVILFAIEMAVRVVELGLIETPTAYLRNGWNVVDAIGEHRGRFIFSSS